MAMKSKSAWAWTAALLAIAAGAAAPEPPKSAPDPKPAAEAKPEAEPAPAKSEPATSIYESAAPATPAGELDKIVFAKLKSLGITPVLCSDAVFVRRAYLDVIGALPTAQEAKDFIRDTDPQKRTKLIDRLLERREFADYWSMRWGDILRIKAEFPVNLWPNAAQAYHHWVRASIAENKPYDKFVRELLTSSGSNFRVGPVNFYRAVQNKTPEGLASAAALAFMGSRTDSWPRDRFEGTMVFFSQVGYKPTREWKEEHVFWDPLHTCPAVVEEKKEEEKPAPGAKAPPKPEPPPPPQMPSGPLKAVFPDGTKVDVPPDRDPREVFADWLITPQNPWFTRAIANRVWYWIFGRGIVHEPDDIRPDNPPSNPELLAYLEKEMIAGKYDMKRFYRLILTSTTYQFSSLPRSNDPQAEANFAHYIPRRLDAEVLIDAINAITGTTDLYTSPIPEPFTYIPQDMPAVAIADGSITSPFLTLFGRSARATGMENERNNKPVPSQWLHMLNSSHIQQKIDQGPKLKALFAPGRPTQEVLEELYLTVLSRFPTAAEVEVAEEYAAPPSASRSAKPGAKLARPAVKRPTDWVDITWALLNGPEFLYRH